MTTLYPLEALAAKERLQYWQDVVCTTYGPTENKPLSHDAFDGNLAVKSVAGVSYSRIQSNPIEYNRQRFDQGCEQFFLALTLCDETYLTQSGVESKQGRGDLVLYDGALPYRCVFPKGDDQIVMVIPRPLLLRHIPRANDFVSRTLSVESPLGRLATSMLQEIWNAPDVNTTSGERLNTALLDVVATAYETAYQREESLLKPHQALQLQRIKDYLLDNLHDAALTIERIAQANFVAPRTLNRLFASEGTTAIRWLWMQRLSGCHDALVAGRFAQVTEAAISYGFTNLSHFSHAFKRTYGVTPQQLLRSH